MISLSNQTRIFFFFNYVRNRLLRGIFGTIRDAVTGEWRKLHNDEFNDLDSSPNIVRVIGSRKMR